MIDQMTDAFFAERVGRAFGIRVGEQTASLVLHECRRLGAPPAGGRVPFSVLFRGPLELRLPQGTYELKTPDAESLPLFLVPLAPDASGTVYEAIFT